MKSEVRKFFLLIFLQVLVLLCFAGIGIYWCLLEQFDLQVVRTSVSLPEGYKNLAGMKIVLFSDLHMIDTTKDLARFRQCIRRINAEKPDLILFAGDLVASDNLETLLPPARIIARMRNLRAKYGVFAVTGNHDWYSSDGKILTQKLQQTGIQVLDNRTVTIPGKFNLTGVQDTAGPDGPKAAKAMRGTAPELPTLALIHRPHYWTLFPSSVKLFFAGHTHGGQIQLPVFREILLHHNGCSAYPEHCYSFPGNRKMFITYGIGTSWIRVRIECPPEIMIITCKETPEHENPAE